ncbi:MAG: hypothetical protein ACK56I_28295, partial [bacterium]
MGGGGDGAGANRCLGANNGCAELCLFNGASSVCHCAFKRLGADGRSCEDYAAFVLFSAVNSIESLHLEPSNSSSPPSPP